MFLRRIKCRIPAFLRLSLPLAVKEKRLAAERLVFILYAISTRMLSVYRLSASDYENLTDPIPDHTQIKSLMQALKIL